MMRHGHGHEAAFAIVARSRARAGGGRPALYQQPRRTRRVAFSDPDWALRHRGTVGAIKARGLRAPRPRRLRARGFDTRAVTRIHVLRDGNPSMAGSSPALTSIFARTAKPGPNPCCGPWRRGPDDNPCWSARDCG